MFFNKEEIEKRIFLKTKPGLNGCLDWIGAKGGNGYGRIRIKSKLYLPHRIIFEAFYGKNPGNFMVCHKCDNRFCVNPNHLFLGTRSDNMRDCYEKGRLPKNLKNSRGEGVGTSKLKNSDILKIKSFLEKGLSQSHIAKIFFVHRSQINRIAKGKAWKHFSKSQARASVGRCALQRIRRDAGVKER